MLSYLYCPSNGPPPKVRPPKARNRQQKQLRRRATDDNNYCNTRDFWRNITTPRGTRKDTRKALASLAVKFKTVSETAHSLELFQSFGHESRRGEVCGPRENVGRLSIILFAAAGLRVLREAFSNVLTFVGVAFLLGALLLSLWPAVSVTLTAPAVP